MSVVYQLAVTPAQVESFLDEGIDFFCGFAVDADRASKVAEVSDLIDLMQCALPGAPFYPDEPINVLRVPTHPFVQSRRAVGSLHPEAFMGGITEFPPFDGTGVASAAGVETALMWVEPARLSPGSKLWRFHPGNPRPELLGIYHGIAWGWETVAKGTFKAAIPSQLLGPATQREWGLAPVDVEVEGARPEAITMVAPGRPPEEGFEKLPTGLWAKRVEYHDELDLHENQLIGRINDVPVRLIRPLRDHDGTVVAQAAAVLVDSRYALGKGFQHHAPGVLIIHRPLAEVTDEQTREVRANTWDLTGRSAITTVASHKRDNEDAGALVRDAHALVNATAPRNWSEFRIVMQIIGTQANFSASAMVDGESIPAPDLPTALIRYIGQLKALNANERRGAPLTLILEFESDGGSTFNMDFASEPPFVDEVPVDEWVRELSAFPRETIPGWAAERFG